MLIPGLGVGFVVLADIGDFLVGTPRLERLTESIIRLLVTNEPVAPPGRRSGHRRHLLLNLVYAVFLAQAVAGWFVPAWPGGAVTALAYHGALPLALLFGFRHASRTPWPWLLRFVPDAAALTLGCAGMIAGGIVRVLAGGS